MNDKQRARLAMLQATLAVLDQHADLYATNAALTGARATLADLVEQAAPTAATQQQAGRPQTAGAVKKATRLRLAERAAELAAALLALADEQDDISLHTDADYTERQLRRSTDNDLPRIAQHLHDRATEHLTALQQQNVTAEELQQLAAAIAQFRQEQAMPRTATAETKAQNQQLAATLRQANSLLRNRLDKYLLRYQRPQPAFYTAYQSARQTINKAGRSEK